MSGSQENKYAPLDPDDDVHPKHPPDDEWTPIPPAPDGEKLPRSLIEKCCPPDHVFAAAWTYIKADGKPICVVVRYTERANGSGKPRKQFRPFIFCENAKGRREWRSKTHPEPRPLYTTSAYGPSRGPRAHR
jgi:hypothetical protein